MFCRCDVSDREDVFRVAEKVKKEVGDVTILVNNAGAVVIKSLMNQSFDEITRVVNINVMAHYWVSNIPEICIEDIGNKLIYLITYIITFLKLHILYKLTK